MSRDSDQLRSVTGSIPVNAKLIRYAKQSDGLEGLQWTRGDGDSWHWLMADQDGQKFGVTHVSLATDPELAIARKAADGTVYQSEGEDVSYWTCHICGADSEPNSGLETLIHDESCPAAEYWRRRPPVWERALGAS